MSVVIRTSVPGAGAPPGGGAGSRGGAGRATAGEGRCSSWPDGGGGSAASAAGRGSGAGGGVLAANPRAAIIPPGPPTPPILAPRVLRGGMGEHLPDGDSGPGRDLDG